MEFWQTYLMVKDKLDMLTLLPDEYYRDLYRKLAIMCEEVNFEYHADMAVNPSWDLEMLYMGMIDGLDDFVEMILTVNEEVFKSIIDILSLAMIIA